MRTKSRLTPYHFFLSNAGYSYDPKTQTPMQGRIACARQLAAAEDRACQAGVTFEWEIDQDIDSSEWSDEQPPWQTWNCVAKTDTGEIFASLCGIDFGRDGYPNPSNKYRRVVEAELACELPTEN